MTQETRTPRDPSLTTPGGWVVAVLLLEPDTKAYAPHYFAVGFPDQGKAEWIAMDRALLLGEAATGPRGGIEPVRAERLLTLSRMKTLGLKPGEVRDLGAPRPRKWIDG